MMTIEQFIKNFCRNCGTQRCEGPGSEWFEGCKYAAELGGCYENPNIIDDCPLVPVPSHGKLIDADALIKQIEFEIRHYVIKDEFNKGRVAGWKDIIRAIREYAPTIIPASEEGEINETNL